MGHIKNLGKGCFLVYGDIMPIESIPRVPVADEAPAMDANTRKKLERVLELLEQFVLNSDVSDDESDPGRIYAAMVAQKKQREAKAERDLQAAQRAYMDRNPHYSKGEKPKVRKDGRFGYEYQEDRVIRKMADEEAEEAYAARNPHKRRGARRYY